ncbi:glycoside hydrolase family 38 C-terminal domain-containing protein [Actinomadura oligospora]|uniref:glycoside hydrolase family 38 N-terminal domain-containing protein n=1 Tax=Actinomadura oligospora TaxID=111804 RepID=UPI00047E2374|nr:glycoside hydrolase family 38 C-terminal domain-containing protein [Actinomadura oligospora]
MRLTDSAIDDGLVVVPHTHWDREWYLPFQRFRLRLVGLLDDVLERMDRDPRLRFTLDGQMAAVDDYLEIRPERAELVGRLVRDGRLAVGPWQILMDEFLCSGETIVRNLELGLRRADDLGGAMRLGYLPDMFGHIAQMPQILRGFGLDRACVWRGVPERVTTHAFAWRAPDGSAVRTEYLPGGYGNAVHMFGDAGLVDGRAEEVAAWLREWRPEGGPSLAMYGSDHTAPAADLAEQVENASLPMRLATLGEFLTDASLDGLPVVEGEMRSHARANILPGVFSVRIPLKAAMGAAERRVARYAEPLAALWLADGSADRFLELAWRKLIEVSCHDSVTGCGSDATAQQVAARMAEAEQLGHAVFDLVTGRLAAEVDRSDHLVVNPSPVLRRGVIRVGGPRDGELRDGRLRGGGLQGGEPVLVEVPPLGVATARAAAVQPRHPARVEADRPANDLVDVRDLGRIVDGGDVGDTYNYAPPKHDVVVDEPLSEQVRVVETGPLVASVAVDREYRWPVEADADARSDATATVVVRTLAEVHADEPFTRMTVAFDNPSRDHRVRLHLPLPRRAASSFGEGQFAVVERGLTGEGGHGEVPVPTFTAHAFVAAGGLAVLLRHVTEYEIVNDGAELALTLLRSVNWLSRDDNGLREEPAGPQIATPDAQCLGPHAFELALMRYDGDRPGPEVLAAAELYGHELRAVRGIAPEGTPAPAPRSGLGIEGDGVVLSSLRRRDGRLELRVVNERPEPGEVVVTGDFGSATRCDLAGRPAGEVDVASGRCVLPLRPWEIATVTLS